MALDVFGIVGSVIAGTYRIEEVVAEGGFAVVYRAHHSGFSAAVAMKCLKVPQQLTLERQNAFLAQFRKEAELLFQLSASIPNVVRPLHIDALTTPGGAFVPYMVLEWLDGETLDQIVERRKQEGRPPLTVKRLVRMLTPVARALERAHNFKGPSGRVSVVHRDLKPDNIFIAQVAGEEVAKILDFGIARAKSVASQAAGRASQQEGRPASFTPAYGAPEQWTPKRYGQTGPWTDVWGLALTMVEVLAARPIIDGDQTAMMGTCLDEKRRPTPRQEGVEVSDAVEAVFERALALDPRKRPADAGEFWDELLEALGMSEKEIGQRRGKPTEIQKNERPADAAVREEREVDARLAPPEPQDRSPHSFDYELAAHRPSGARPAWAPPSQPAAAPELAILPSESLLPIELAERPRSKPSSSAANFAPPLDVRAPPIRSVGPGGGKLTPSSRRRLRQGVALVVSGTLIGLVDRLYQALTEQNLLPLPLVYVSGPLILVGVVAIIVGLLPAEG